MKVAMVGLGRMGGSMAARLAERGHEVSAFDPDSAARDRARAVGVAAAPSLSDAVVALHPPRTVWVMVPAGRATDEAMVELEGLLDAGDVVVDGGNSNWKDSVRRAERLGERGISLLDCGTSGGIWGRTSGYCLMVGGDEEAFRRAEPLFEALSAAQGYARVGASGAGHFVKMVHNGIEYGLLAAYGEGFEVLHTSPFDLDLPRVANVWLHGSVVRSWLLELLAEALSADPALSGIRGHVEDSGEGRWAIEAAIEQEVPAPITALSLFARFASRSPESYAAKVVAALRREFGGHGVRRAAARSSEPGRPKDPPLP